MERWEYKCLPVHSWKAEPNEIGVMFDELGEMGWELVTIVSRGVDTEETVAVFKQVVIR